MAIVTATAPKTKTYTAKVVRFGDWWAIDVPEVPGIHTQTKSLEDVEAMAVDAIAATLDIPHESVLIRVDTTLDEETAKLVEEAHQAREAAARAQAEAAEAVTTTVKHLGTRGVSVRDAGFLLGMSYQRVAQIRNKAITSLKHRKDVMRTDSKRRRHTV